MLEKYMSSKNTSFYYKRLSRVHKRNDMFKHLNVLIFFHPYSLSYGRTLGSLWLEKYMSSLTAEK
jgi:hypothetical protein